MLREIDGLKIAFMGWERYTQDFNYSMCTERKKHGADIVLLLAEGVDPNTLSDDTIRGLVTTVYKTFEVYDD